MATLTIRGLNGKVHARLRVQAICASRNATLATRNVEDFEGTGIRLLNRWDHD
ncbi:MAG TPA: hypothetical protein VFN97_18950 [Actinospica sp.]|nr:hypothetical protein [Actinospica sp.]